MRRLQRFIHVADIDSPDRFRVFLFSTSLALDARRLSRGCFTINLVIVGMYDIDVGGHLR